MKIFVFFAILTFMVSCIFLQAQQQYDGEIEHFTAIREGKTDYLVTKFTLSKPWVIPQKVAVIDETMEQWKHLVLIGHSDAARLFTNKQLRRLHEAPNEITDDLIEAQKNRMRKRYSKPSAPVSVASIFLVIDKKIASAHLVIEFESKLGVHYTAFERIDANWKIVVSDAPAAVLISFPSILSTYNNQVKKGSQKLSDKELEEFTKSHVDGQTMRK